MASATAVRGHAHAEKAGKAQRVSIAFVPNGALDMASATARTAAANAKRALAGWPATSERVQRNVAGMVFARITVCVHVIKAMGRRTAQYGHARITAAVKASA